MLPDNGEYGRMILEGDIHQMNADNLGISRDQAKTVQYAMLYGSGDRRLGEILGAGAEEGRELKRRYFRSPAFGLLMRQIKHALATRGHLIGLDGRRLPVRSPNTAALNVLLQSAAALIAKKMVQLVDQELNRQWHRRQMMAFVHDEIRHRNERRPASCRNRDCAVRMAEEAGRHFGFKIPIDAEYHVGRTWADVH